MLREYRRDHIAACKMTSPRIELSSLVLRIRLRLLAFPVPRRSRGTSAVLSVIAIPLLATSASGPAMLESLATGPVPLLLLSAVRLSLSLTHVYRPRPFRRWPAASSAILRPSSPYFAESSRSVSSSAQLPARHLCASQTCRSCKCRTLSKLMTSDPRPTIVHVTRFFTP
jgi:hypothetical protein